MRRRKKLTACTYGGRVRQARQAASMTQQELAAAIGIPQSQLSDIERDRSPYWQSACAQMQALAEATRYSADALIG